MIIVVDDDESMTEVYRTFFDEDELDWQVFENGYQVLNCLIESENVEAVILDIMMPVLDGLTVSEEIRRNEHLNPHRPPVKLAFYTSFPKSEAVERIAARARVEKYFEKPKDIPELISEVKEWLCM